MSRIVKSFSNSINKILLDHPSNYMHVYTAAQVKNLKDNMLNCDEQYKYLIN